MRFTNRPYSKDLMHSLWAWALYDFANTIFSAIVLTAYFPLYLTELAGANWYLGAATTGAMLLAGIFTPVMGAFSDQTGKTKACLIHTTLASIACLYYLSVFKTVPFLIGAFIFSCFFYHLALVFYNSLLVVVAPPEKQGFASGLGTGLGYLGVVFALPIAHWTEQHFGRSRVFIAAAILFLLFSLPAFFFVGERKVAAPVSPSWHLWLAEWKKIFTLIKKLPQQPALLLFLGGNFFAVDALNSAICWLMVYTREVFHPQQGALISFLTALNASAFFMGILAGILTDRWGAARTLTLSSALLAVTLAILAITPSFPVFLAANLTGGAFAIAGIWTAGRKRLVDLAPPEDLGGTFGLYGLVTKVSVVGSLLFSIIADLAGFRQALWILVFSAGLGCFFLTASALIPEQTN